MQVGASFNSNIISGVSFSMFHKITLRSRPQVATRFDFIILSRLSLLVYHDISTTSYSCSQYYLKGLGLMKLKKLLNLSSILLVLSLLPSLPKNSSP